MNIIKALLMGLIQGVTEFLPVSSSGHLAIFKQVLGINLDSGMYFDVMLHLGTLVAVIIVFREDIWGMIREFWGMLVTIFANFLVFIVRRRGNTEYKYFKVINSSYRKLVLMVIISTIPTGILGMVGSDLIEKASGTLWVVGMCLILTAVLLLLADKHPDGNNENQGCALFKCFYSRNSAGHCDNAGIIAFRNNYSDGPYAWI